jgi:hypothetical protein
MCKTSGNLTKKAQFQSKLIIYLLHGTEYWYSTHQNIKKKTLQIFLKCSTFNKKQYSRKTCIRIVLNTQKKKGASSATSGFYDRSFHLKNPGKKTSIPTSKIVEFKNLLFKTQMMSKYDVPWSRECKDDSGSGLRIRPEKKK